MDCIKTICLYLKDYLSDEQFNDFFYDYLYNFQNCLEEDVYIDVLFTNINSKEERISMKTELKNYILNNYASMYEEINDAYVERMVDSDEEDIVVKILKKRYEQIEKIDIDCSMINTQSELIDTIKQKLQYPQFCGDSWDAIEDLIHDIILPKRLTFYDWYEIEKKIPQDTAILKAILDRNNSGRCIIVYV